MSAKIKSAITLGLLLHLGMIRANAYTTTDANADGEGSIGGHEYVDLGLPSGNLWAKCNIGAETPKEFGEYYAWGEIETRDSFSWRNYDFLLEIREDHSIVLTDIGDDIGGTQYDPVHTKWGNGWELPSLSDFNELLANCETQWYEKWGVVSGLVVSALNGNSIFLPITLSDNGIQPSVIKGSYWSSTRSDSNRDNWENFAMTLCFYNSKPLCEPEARFMGLSIRPVYKGTHLGVDAVSAKDLIKIEGNRIVVTTGSDRMVVKIHDIAGRLLKSVESDGRNGLELTMPGGAYVCSLHKDGRLMHTSKIILR